MLSFTECLELFCNPRDSNPNLLIRSWPVNLNFYLPKMHLYLHFFPTLLTPNQKVSCYIRCPSGQILHLNLEISREETGCFRKYAGEYSLASTNYFFFQSLLPARASHLYSLLIEQSHYLQSCKRIFLIQTLQ